MDIALAFFLSIWIPITVCVAVFLIGWFGTTRARNDYKIEEARHKEVQKMNALTIQEREFTIAHQQLALESAKTKYYLNVERDLSKQASHYTYPSLDSIEEELGKKP